MKELLKNSIKTISLGAIMSINACSVFAKPLTQEQESYVKRQMGKIKENINVIYERYERYTDSIPLLHLLAMDPEQKENLSLALNMIPINKVYEIIALRDGSGFSALDRATMEGNEKAVEELLKNLTQKQFFLICYNSYKNIKTTPLHIAADKNNLKIEKILLDKLFICKFEILDAVLDIAAKNGNVMMIGLLLEKFLVKDAIKLMNTPKKVSETESKTLLNLLKENSKNFSLKKTYEGYKKNSTVPFDDVIDSLLLYAALCNNHKVLAQVLLNSSIWQIENDKMRNESQCKLPRVLSIPQPIRTDQDLHKPRFVPSDPLLLPQQKRKKVINAQAICRCRPVHVVSKEIKEAINAYQTMIRPLYIPREEEREKINPETAKEIRNKNIETLICIKDFDGNTVLHFAALHGNADILKTILSLVAKLSPEKLKQFIMRKNDKGETVLHLAALHGSADIVKTILSLVAKLSPEKLDDFIMGKNNNGATVLHMAVMCQNGAKKDIADTLLNNLSKGKIVNFIMESDNQDNTILHYWILYAKKKSIPDIIKSLFDNWLSGKKTGYKIYASPEQIINFINKKNYKKKTVFECLPTRGGKDLRDFYEQKLKEAESPTEIVEDEDLSQTEIVEDEDLSQTEIVEDEDLSQTVIVED